MLHHINNVFRGRGEVEHALQINHKKQQ